MKTAHGRSARGVSARRTKNAEKIEQNVKAPEPRKQAPANAEDLEKALAKNGYLADSRVALAAWLALRLDKPLLVEGPAGVGKTELARTLSSSLGRALIRLQCYEGLDEARALYEWDYPKQMIFAQLLRDTVGKKTASAKTLSDAVNRLADAGNVFFNEKFLIARPILKALVSDEPVVLLIDEVDRADPEFEAFLLEVLADNQVTLPELGTVRAKHPPLTILTTNGTREMTDALRRRCLHAFLDYPPPSREQAILELRVPGISKQLAEQLSAFASKVRTMDLRKLPSISETIDWARALVTLGASALEKDLARETLGALLKHEQDRARVEQKIATLISG